jgi:hypothetical protein
VSARGEAANGGVSNVDRDGNSTLYTKIIGVIISTFETLPTSSSSLRPASADTEHMAKLPENPASMGLSGQNDM